jgi:hypothetical protein
MSSCSHVVLWSCGLAVPLSCFWNCNRPSNLTRLIEATKLLCACSASFFLSPCLSGSAGRNHFMIELIKFAGSNRRRRRQLHKRRRARPQPGQRRRPRRGSRLFPVTRPRVLPLRRAAPGCGTPPIAILSTVLLTRPGILRPNKQRNNPAKPTGSTVAACAIQRTPLRRPRRRRRASVVRQRSEVGRQRSARQAVAVAKAGGQRSEVSSQ